jgi:hypothetical protein
MQRVLEWAFGEYTIELGSGKGEIKVKVKVDASLGMAEWKVGEAMQ